MCWPGPGEEQQQEKRTKNTRLTHLWRLSVTQINTSVEIISQINPHQQLRMET